MVSAGISVAGNLHFVDEKAKVNADYYVNNLIPKLVEDAIALMPDGFIFRLTPRVRRKTGYTPAVMTSLRRMNGQQ